MSIQTLAQALPPYAKDLVANLQTVADDRALSDQQRWGALLASAYATGSGTAIRELSDGSPLSDGAAEAAKAAAAIMGMNNVFYRALHMLQNREYATLPARLRMSVVANPGAPKTDFELWCLAVSAINGCAACLDSHEDELRKRGVAPVAILGAIRIGAVVNAVARVLQAEDALAAAKPEDEGG